MVYYVQCIFFNMTINYKTVPLRFIKIKCTWGVGQHLHPNGHKMQPSLRFWKQNLVAIKVCRWDLWVQVLLYLIGRDERGWRFGQGGNPANQWDRRWAFLLFLLFVSALHRTFLGHIFISHILSIAVGNCCLLEAVGLPICTLKRVIHLKGFLIPYKYCRKQFEIFEVYSFLAVTVNTAE